MRRTRMAPVIALAVLAATPVACSKSSTTAPNVQLSQTQVTQLYSEVTSVLASLGASFNLSSYAHGSPLFGMVPGRAPAASGTISGSGACPNGGTASFSGSASQGTNPVTFSFGASFTSCKTTDFTVDGSINESGSVNTTTSSGSITITGNLSVVSSSGSGSCPLNFTVSFTSSSATASGSICGQSVNGVI